MARVLDWMSRLGVAASSSKLGGIFYYTVCRRVDSVLIPLTSGRLSMGPPGQTVLVTTTGAKSGQPRKASLAFLFEADDMVIVASKGGSPAHPAWYHNMKADPHVVVQHRGGIEERIAREAVGGERDALFARMAGSFANFAAYQARATNRKIPVMVLSRPRSGS
jgi:F420H(2)-dependent quinone reductase